MLKKQNCKRTMLLKVIFAACVECAFVVFFIIVPFENNLATHIQSHIAQQVKNRHEKYVRNDDISIYIKEAAIASQDKRFYTNIGIDVFATMRAIYFTLLNGKKQGASTITEQLAKNVYYHDTDTLLTDLQTKILAIFITTHFTKDKILEMYLNDIYYGKGAYGIFDASQTYFHQVPSHLNIAQAVYLIALINAPSYLSTHTNQTIMMAKYMLQEMANNHYISQQQASNSLKLYTL